MVKNLPANAGDMGSIPEPGRSHMLWGRCARAPHLLSLCCRNPEATTTETMYHNYGNLSTLEPVLHDKGGYCNESPCTAAREKLAQQ